MPGGKLKGILGITGTPGTGKKSVAPLAAELLGVVPFSIDELALALGSAEADGDGYQVDTARLRRKIRSVVPRPSALYGHLLPSVLDPTLAERVVVLRCEPRVLGGRLRARGYPGEKVRANLEAELIGLVASEARGAFGARTREVDTTSTTPEEAAATVVAVARGRAGGSRIDWTRNYDSAPKLRSLLPTE
ncbi:MAG: AAA family ATPase [Nitrososphaerota archaeon]|jgi:adenylate kinase|nr:AAA family ATPase [Nitrososphaerota archaeon]MDG6946133.1 AAA family ATPase [Nitrososphaerota archaeon]